MGLIKLQRLQNEYSINTVTGATAKIEVYSTDIGGTTNKR